MKSEKDSSVPDAAKSFATLKTKEGHGSGCLISKDGLILTNYHVVGDSPSWAPLLFEDGAKDSGIVVRVYPEYDLALIKINTPKLKPLK